MSRVIEVALHRQDGIGIYEGIPPGQTPDAAHLTDIRDGLMESLCRARQLLLDLGAHGDVRLILRVMGGLRHLMYTSEQGIATLAT